MRFPKRLYVKIEKDGDSSYPVACEQLIDVADMNAPIRIGIYELVETTYVECHVKTGGTVRKR